MDLAVIPCGGSGIAPPPDGGATPPGVPGVIGTPGPPGGVTGVAGPAPPGDDVSPGPE